MRRYFWTVLYTMFITACQDVAAPRAGPLLEPLLAKPPGNAGTTITFVGPVDGSQAEDVNDAGEVVGMIGMYGGSPWRAFIWRPAQPRGTSGTLEDLGTLGGPSANAKAINNAGHVVGGTTTASGAPSAFLWTPNGGMQDLGAPPAADGAFAMDVSESGHVAGYSSYVSANSQRAVLWTVTVSALGTVQVVAIEELPTLPGATSTIAFGVNDLGQAVGWASPGPSGSNHAVLWTKVSGAWMVEDLGMLPDGRFSVAQDVNAVGHVVGYSVPSQGCPSAVVWTTVGGHKIGMRALPSLGGCTSEAYGINEQSEVVGRSQDRRGPTHATMWRLAADASVLETRDLGKPSGTAASLTVGLSAHIDGITQVAGISRSTKGVERATLWTVR